MSFWRIVWRSLWQHRGSTVVALTSLALGVTLLIAVTLLREQAHRHFAQSGFGVDAVLGPKGSPLQIVLNACYHLEDMPGKIPWPYYQAVRAHDVVADGFPFVTGHSWSGWRVNGLEKRFLTDFMADGTNHFRCVQGRFFNASHEAVLGSAVAQALHITLGQTFNPTCGVNAGDPVHNDDHITIVGILEPTGTPHDRAIYIPLETFFHLEGHGAAVAAMAEDLEHREISGAYLQLTRIRGGAWHPGVQSLQYEINQSTKAQLVLPAEVMPRLMGIIGWVDYVLWAVAALVTILAALFLTFALLATLRERRRDLALLRALGAPKLTVVGIVLAQAVIISVVGALVGAAGGHLLSSIVCQMLASETGLHFNPWVLSSADLALLPAAGILGVLAGSWPAIQAYRLALLEALSPHT